MERVDIAIIGTGPAGISAAVNARIRNKSFLLFGNDRLSGKVECSEYIDNYPGVAHITGAELNQSFREQMDGLGIEITGARITGIYNMGEYYLIMADSEEYEAKSIILATGVESRRAIHNEREFLGRGVSYCATCDGRLYRGRNIAIICDNKSMEEEVEFLAQIAGKIYYFPLFKSDFKKDNIEIMTIPVASIYGRDYVEGIELKNGTKIGLDGIFFLKQSVSADVLLRGLKMNDGHIVVDRNMSTNMPGCFAAGDCTGRPYQIAKAVGEGNIAAHSAIAYLAGVKGE